jgi:acyl-CoA thioesterase
MPDGPGWLAVTPPAELAAGPDAVPEVRIGPPLAPDFTAHLEMRPITGIPYSGADSDQTRGWIRPRGPVERVDAAVVTALADAWWVSVMARLDRPRPAATVGFTLDFPSDPSCLPRDEWGRMQALFHRGHSVTAREGFTIEVRELWTRTGQLISWNTQTVVVIK